MGRVGTAGTAVRRPAVRRSAVLLLAGAIVVGVGVGGATLGTVHSAGAPARQIPALPRLGPVTMVDQNDVGDPFILTVPPGVPPPEDIPYLGPGPDSYQSSPWSAATATRATAHGWYVLFGTTDWQANVPTAVSTDLVHWTQAPDSLPVLPAWAAPSISMTWAPAAVPTSAGWVLYYSTEDAANGLECIGRAVSSSSRPAGPYQDRTPAPMLCQPRLGGSIDPTVVQARGGAKFLLWKNDGNAVHAPDSIWTQQLTPDGLGLIGRPDRLIGADEAWEHGIVEAPAMLPASAGGYWLFYAGGDWSSNEYGTGLAYCTAITGPCTETSTRPFLATNSSVVSPGGLDTIRDGRGHIWAAFTALVPVPSTRHPGRVYYNRVLDIAPILSR